MISHEGYFSLYLYVIRLDLIATMSYLIDSNTYHFRNIEMVQDTASLLCRSRSTEAILQRRTLLDPVRCHNKTHRRDNSLLSDSTCEIGSYRHRTHCPNRTAHNPGQSDPEYWISDLRMSIYSVRRVGLREISSVKCWFHASREICSIRNWNWTEIEEK